MFQKNLYISFLLVTFMESHIQFIVFMFFRQMREVHILNFNDKINLLFACLFNFIAIIFAFASYPLFSHFGKQIFLQLFPNYIAHSKRLYIKFLLIGGFRRVALGAIQSSFENFDVQIIALTILNLITFFTYKSLYQ